jgi:hypothetical protein
VSRPGAAARARRLWYARIVHSPVRLARCILLALAIGAASAAWPAAAGAEPPTTHEILSNRPSGFWTSNRPAVGGAYRWRLLGIGVGIAVITGYGMLRLVRRASAERASRQR